MFVRSRAKKEVYAAAVAVAAAALASSGSPCSVRADNYWQGGAADYNTANWTFVDFSVRTNTAPANVTRNSPAPQEPTPPPLGFDGGNLYNAIVGGQYNAAATSSPATNVTTPSGTATVGPADPAWSVWDLRGGDVAGGTGTFVQTGSTVTVNSWLRLATTASTSAGAYNLSAGVLNTNGEDNVAEQGRGTVNLSGTGTLNAGNGQGDAVVAFGKGAGAVGTLNMTGGAFNTVPSVVATSSGQAVNLAPQCWIGEGTGSTTAVGVANVSGGTVALDNWLAVGRDSGTGTLNLSGTAAVTKLPTSNGQITVGSFAANSVGVINQSGGTLSNTGSDTWIGENGTGTYNATGGTASLGVLAVGQGGVLGTVSVTGTAQVTATSVVVARMGAVNGVLTVGNGGLLNTQLFYRGTSTGTATVNLNAGGTIQAAADNAAFANSFKAGELNVNGGTIDTNGHAVTIPGPLSGAGGFVKAGAGVLTVGSTANTYTGPTTVSAGTLRLTAPSVAAIPASAVAAYYSFEDPNTLLADASPNHNDLQQGTDASGNPVGLVSSSTLAPPTPGGAVHTGSVNLTGKAFFTYVGTNGTPFPTAVPTGNAAYTIAAWVDVSGQNLTGNGYGIAGWGSYGTNNQANAFRTVGTTGLDNYWWNNDLAANVSAGTVLTNTWHYVAATFDPTVGTGGQRTVTLDGAVVAQDSPGQAHNVTATNFAVGVTDAALYEYFDGNMADLLIANQALTPAQLAVAQTGNLNGVTTSAGLLPSTTTVSVAAGATFDVNGNLQAVAGLTGPAGSAVALGSGTLTVTSATSGEFDGVISGTGGLTANAGTGTLTLGGANTYAGPTVVNGKLTIAANNASSGLLVRTLTGPVTVGPAGLLTVAAAATLSVRQVLVLPGGLGFNAAGGRLNLTTNDLDLPNGNLAAVTAAVATGYAGGTFGGPGIASSAAAVNPARNTTLGIILNSTTGMPGGAALKSVFDTVPVTATDVLVKYTYYGDANLDGAVNGLDFGRIDAGFNSQAMSAPLTGWYNGDFNYDGKVDGSDYTLIDNAFNTQGVAIASSSGISAESTAEVASAFPSAVPEPSSILAVVAAVGSVGRRRPVGVAAC